jgi:hypothetical protein
LQEDLWEGLDDPDRLHGRPRSTSSTSWTRRPRSTSCRGGFCNHYTSCRSYMDSQRRHRQGCTQFAYC